MVVQTLGPDDEDTKDTVLDVQQNLNDFILVEKEKVDKDEPIILDGEMIAEILTDAGISEPKAEKSRIPTNLSLRKPCLMHRNS